MKTDNEIQLQELSKVDFSNQNQELFELIQDMTGYICVESELQEIVDCVEKNNIS